MRAPEIRSVNVASKAKASSSIAAEPGIHICMVDKHSNTPLTTYAHVCTRMRAQKCIVFYLYPCSGRKNAHKMRTTTLTYA